MNGEPAEGRFPLVAISHGSGGSPLLYRTLAAHLARNGFIAVAPEHVGNSRNNNELAGTERLLAERPRQLRLAIDALLKNRTFADRLQPGRAAVIGHSMGGYTALALAGGRPTALDREKNDREKNDSGFRLPASFKDDRVQALVLLAPATVWFGASGALNQVRAPVFMVTAEHDPHTPPFHAGIVRNGLRGDTPLTHETVPNAGHFSFLSPFPPALVDPRFPPSQDPPGFDRAAFHEWLNAAILNFLRRCFPVQ